MTDLDALRRELVRELCRLALSQAAGDWERALWAIEFFKTRSAAHVMRGFREALHRAELYTREAALVRAMACFSSGTMSLTPDALR